MKNILIYRLGSLGDTVLVLPSLSYIRRRYPGARITLLTNHPVGLKAPPMMEILGGSGIVDQLISYPLGTRDWSELARLHQTLRKARFDLLVYLAAARGLIGSMRDFLFFRSCGIKAIAGLPWRPEDLRCLPASGQTGLYEWEAARLARRVRTLGLVDLNDSSLWSLKLATEESTEAVVLLRGAGISGPFIAASVGTKIQANHWTVKNWCLLFSALAPLSENFALVAVGSSDEYSEAEGCLEFWPGTKANLCGRTRPRVAAAALREAKLYIGHDSGLLHLAALVGTRCIGIYSGRNPPGQWYPKGEGHEIFYRQVDCFGCLLSTCIVQEKKCILSISPADVAAAVHRSLSLPAGTESQPN